MTASWITQLSMEPVLVGLGTHTLFIGEVVDAGLNDEDARAAAMSDTRMTYGGVRRH